MDIYSKLYRSKSQRHYVSVGRWVSFGALIVALMVAQPLLGQFDQAFQYIQEFTGFFTPGIVVIFILGLFWSKASATGALAAAIGSAVLSLTFMMLWPELPFIDRVGLVFLLCLVLAVVISLLEGSNYHEFSNTKISYQTSSVFNIASIALTVVISALYATWW